ncbi:AAA family ATPase [Spirochaetia bacterium 38H-sp]|uniref:Replication-associated recombination protein A n=1 Tax=Rarispira pelagica TaxID=3141764 RepID=A0ABU9UE83_9SPIR
MDNNLFSAASREKAEPLAARMRPRTIDEFVGQEHILGPGRLLRRAIQADRLSSLIFYGPPGCGKTTLARVIANTTKSAFLSLNAVLSGVKEVREAIAKAQEELAYRGRRTILFVDEVHRWNKAQQDALLPWVENGTVILIGATTENPYFEVNSALISRSRIFQLLPLTEEHLRQIALNALADPVRGYGKYNIKIDQDALTHLINIANGDARTLLSALELAVETTPDNFPPEGNEPIYISKEVAEESIQRKAVLYDKEGDFHYDIISAFIKSLRGSDPDAAFYWLARMIDAGEDPRFIFRRMLILASEDVGLADPQAIQVVNSCAQAFDRVGMPEGQYHLAQAVLYLATCPKSNSVMGYFDALRAVREEKSHEVPTHLKDSSRDSKGFGHGQGYIYPHAYRDHWVAQNYLPAGLKNRIFYRPAKTGYEARLAEEVEKRRTILMDIETEDTEEILSFTPNSITGWQNRTEEAAERNTEKLLAKITEHAKITRHNRVLVLETPPGLILWQAVRQAAEGQVTAGLLNSKEEEKIKAIAEQFDSLLAPITFIYQPEKLEDNNIYDKIGYTQFERILVRNLLGTKSNKETIIKQLATLTENNGKIVITETIYREGQRLNEIINFRGNEILREELKQAEEEFYSSNNDPRLNWQPETLQEMLIQAGYAIKKAERIRYGVKRIIKKQEIEKWLGDTNSPYSSFMRQKLGVEKTETIREQAITSLAEREIQWKREICIISAEMKKQKQQF